MKYLISEETKAKAIRKNRVLMVLKYGIGMLVVIIILSTEFNSIPPKNLLLFIGIISIVPFACWYIDRDFKNKVNSEYEIVDEKLIITVNGKQKTTELKSIKAITKIPSGHRIISNNGIFYILDEIENKEDLMTKLKE